MFSWQVTHILVSAALLLLPLSAQTTTTKSPAEIKALVEAHHADFDYLLGDWEFTTVSKEYGPGKGLWTAVRLPTGQILDEFRIVGDKGQTYYVTMTLRAYNAALDRWELVSVGDGAGLQDFGTGKRVGDQVQIEQKFGATGQHPNTLRIVYSNIRPDAFSWKADRSNDGGKTWSLDDQKIEARRLAPAHSMASLVLSKTPAQTAEKSTAEKELVQVSAWITKAAEMVPSEKYDYRPTESVRTFGQLIAHIADGNNFYCAQATGKKVDWSSAIEDAKLDKTALAQKLSQSFELCQTAYGSSKQPDSLIQDIGHSSLHYGNAITYLRLLGLTPPSN